MFRNETAGQLDEQSDDVQYVLLRLDPQDFACSDFQDPDFFVHEYTGAVLLAGTAVGDEKPIGTFRCFLVDAESAIAQRVSVFDVFDTRSNTYTYYEYLYEAGHVQHRVLKVLKCEDEYVSPSLLVLDRLEIAPRFRGQGYGLEALRCLMQRFRMGAGLIAMKPFPLQFEAVSLEMSAEQLKDAGFDMFPRKEREATAKLRRYYSQLGFKLIPRTPIMAVCTVLGLHTTD